MSVWKSLAVAVGVAISAFNASSVRADFMLVSQGVTLDRADKTMDFSLTFNQQPNFSVFDNLGRPADSFQVEFDGNLQQGQIPTPNDITSVIRGDEIRFGDGLRIRNANGKSDPDSGGWGPIVGTVPFRLTGDTVSFTAPLNDLGWSGNLYQAKILSLEYGQETAQQVVTMVPTPSAFAAGLGGLIVVAGASKLMRRKLLV